MLLTQLRTFKKHNHEIELLEMRCLAVGTDGNDGICINKRAMSMRQLYCIVLSLILLAVAINLYSFLHVDFFRSVFSIIVNTAALVFTLLYLLLRLSKDKRIKRKLHEQYNRLFSKN